MEYSALPAGFRPEVLRALTMKEFLVIAARYGVTQIGERMGYDENFLGFLQKLMKKD